jgi:hypothetical protein
MFFLIFFYFSIGIIAVNYIRVATYLKTVKKWPVSSMDSFYSLSTTALAFFKVDENSFVFKTH